MLAVAAGCAQARGTYLKRLFMAPHEVASTGVNPQKYCATPLS